MRGHTVSHFHLKGKTMSEVHVKIQSDASGNALKFDNPGVAPAVANAGQPVTAQKDASGKTVAASGQIPGTSVVFNSPA